MSETLNATETMTLLRISRATLRAMLAAGELRGFERGKVIRVDRRSVEALLGRTREREQVTPAVVQAATAAPTAA